MTEIMERLQRVAERTPDQLADDYLHHTDDAILACRGQGHAWPKLRAGRRARKLPKGVQANRWHDGSWQITSTCPDCGTKRTLVTLPGGSIDRPAIYRYEYPEGFKSPPGSGITRRQCFDEEWRRVREELAAQDPDPALAPAFSSAEGVST